MKAFSMYKTGSLRKRWLINTVGVVLVLGLVCVLAVTASFAAYYYSNMEADMRNRASVTTDFFSEYVNQDYILRVLGRPHRSISLMYRKDKTLKKEELFFLECAKEALS